jgi:hypothetical protein
MMLGEDEAETLTAWQARLLLHDTAVRTPIPDGIGSVVHVVPALVVPMTIGLPKMP